MSTTNTIPTRKTEVTSRDDAATAWHALPIEAICQQLQSDPVHGLRSDDAQQRLTRYGANELQEKLGIPAWLRFLHQFKSPLIYVLLVAAVVATFLGEFKDAGVILGVLLANAIVGFIQEGRAERSMAALKKLSAPQSRVRRDGQIVLVPSRELVPGDVLILGAGDRIAADARLTEVAALITLEGALTGESTGVNKKVAVLPPETPLADRKNMVFAGTVVAAGRGEAMVVATGMRSELGKIATMVQEAGTTVTPLQVRMKHFSRVIIIVVLSVMTLVFGLGIWRGLPVRDIFMVALSQAVSAIPEGLPVAVTVALAVGMQRMAKRRAIIRKLAAVETLGSATVICTDKTGTLTKNEMCVTRVVLPGTVLTVTGIGYDPTGEFREGDKPVDIQSAPNLRALLECGVLCNDAVLLPADKDGSWRIDGDPTEGALLVAAQKAGLSPTSLRNQHKRTWEIPFDPKYRMMATGYLLNDGIIRVCVKGAPEEVMALCHQLRRGSEFEPLTDTARDWIRSQQRELSANGLRVLAFAEGTVLRDELSDTYAVAGTAHVFRVDGADRSPATGSARGCRLVQIRRRPNHHGHRGSYADRPSDCTRPWHRGPRVRCVGRQRPLQYDRHGAGQRTRSHGGFWTGGTGTQIADCRKPPATRACGRHDRRWGQRRTCAGQSRHRRSHGDHRHRSRQRSLCDGHHRRQFCHNRQCG